MIEAMKFALKVFDDFIDDPRAQKEINEASTALRQAIAEAEKREWVGLTNEEKRQILLDDPLDWINAIEQALKEKNT